MKAPARAQLPPERKALRVLLASLELAHDAVQREHPRLRSHPSDYNPDLPASELLAELLVTQCARLSDLVHRYNHVIDRVFDDDLPF